MREAAHLATAVGEPGSGRVRYGAAMALYRDGAISAEQLEIYRVASAHDNTDPTLLLQDRGLPLPARRSPAPEDILWSLMEVADNYLSSLSGPGIAEVRSGIAQWRGASFEPATAVANSVVERQLPPALAALAGSHLALSAAIAAASSHLRWITYDLYDRREIGEAFATSHAFCSIMGEAGPLQTRDFDFGLFLIAPHVLYRDHCHAAPELYAPLTGPHGWRFRPNAPLVTKAAHEPVWNEPFRPHLTKVGHVPFLSLYCWTRDNDRPARVLPASDWAKLEAMRL
jgi:Dimethlysulfonioproprionate lyase